MRSTLVLTVVTEGSFFQRRYVVHPDQRLLLGRTEAADLVIADALVGSRQTWLWYQEGTWMVEDARSMAGTYVDGSQASRPTPLPYGAILWAGGLHLRAVEGAPDEPPSVPCWVPGNESTVVLGDDAVWTAPREECEKLALLLDVSSAPVLRPARQGGTVDLRHATGVELLALLGSIESEFARPAFTPAVQGLCGLLRSDMRVASYPLGTPSASDAVRIVNALALRTEDSARRFFRTPGRPEWPALVLRAIASHPDLGPDWAAHYGDRISPFLDEPALAAVVTAMADIALAVEQQVAAQPADSPPRDATPPPATVCRAAPERSCENCGGVGRLERLWHQDLCAGCIAALAAAELAAKRAQLTAQAAEREERARVEYRKLRGKAEARLHKADPSFCPTPPEAISVPRMLDAMCGFTSWSEVTRLQWEKKPGQKDIDTVAELLAGTIETHVLWALRSEDEKRLGERWAAHGHSGVPRFTKEFLSRHRPGAAARQRLELAIAIMSEALKVGIQFWGNDDDCGIERVTVWFELFHDLVADVRREPG